MDYKDFYKEDLIPGGKGDKTDPSTLDQKQLEKGIKVEREHTTDPKKAKEIATDHLTEDPKYYSKLKKAGLADELTKECGVIGIEKAEIAVYVGKSPTTPNIILKNKFASLNKSTKIDHVTGNIGPTPSNSNIISTQTTPATSIFQVSPSIESDVAESKKTIDQLGKDRFKSQNKPKKVAKEGIAPVAGDPDTDSNFVKNKRWTVKYK